ncbi:MAG: hypothetical protein RID07_10045 [Lacipirellulaceae bacterium]
MGKGNSSGYKLKSTDIPIVMGMIARRDRHHDIAAWFGVNQGRIKDAQDGKYGPTTTVASLELPPSGAPGIKGRRLREEVGKLVQRLDDHTPTNVSAVKEALGKALSDFDKDEK